MTKSSIYARLLLSKFGTFNPKPPESTVKPCGKTGTLTTTTNSTRHDTTKTGRAKATTTLVKILVDARVLHHATFTWKDEEKRGDNVVPAHYHARVSGVDVHLRGGLLPDALGAAWIEVRERTVETEGREVSYISLNLYPAPGEVPEQRLLMGEEVGMVTIKRRNGAVTIQAIG